MKKYYITPSIDIMETEEESLLDTSVYQDNVKTTDIEVHEEQSIWEQDNFKF